MSDLKRRFTALYLEYTNEARSCGYDCGGALLHHLRPHLAVKAQEINRLAEQLAETDPDFPKDSWRPL